MKRRSQGKVDAVLEEDRSSAKQPREGTRRSTRTPLTGRKRQGENMTATTNPEKSLLSSAKKSKPADKTPTPQKPKKEPPTSPARSVPAKSRPKLRRSFGRRRTLVDTRNEIDKLCLSPLVVNKGKLLDDGKSTATKKKLFADVKVEAADEKTVSEKEELLELSSPARRKLCPAGSKNVSALEAEHQAWSQLQRDMPEIASFEHSEQVEEKLRIPEESVVVCVSAYEDKLAMLSESLARKSRLLRAKRQRKHLLMLKEMSRDRALLIARHPVLTRPHIDVVRDFLSS